MRQSRGSILPREKMAEQEVTSEETQAGGAESAFSAVEGGGLVGDAETKDESTEERDDADRMTKRGAIAFTVSSKSVC